MESLKGVHVIWSNDEEDDESNIIKVSVLQQHTGGDRTTINEILNDQAKGIPL
jgi:hypothetical protein